MVVFHVVWAIDIVLSLVLLVFFALGISDGTVSSFNIVLWIGLLAAAAGVVFGSRALAQAGRVGPAIALAALPAVPAVLAVIALLIAMVSGVRWN
jgi:hypothetical protein